MIIGAERDTVALHVGLIDEETAYTNTDAMCSRLIGHDPVNAWELYDAGWETNVEFQRQENCLVQVERVYMQPTASCTIDRIALSVDDGTVIAIVPLERSITTNGSDIWLEDVRVEFT